MCTRLKFIILRKQKNERPHFISIQRRVSEEITMIFANYHELETAKEQLKAELKTQVTKESNHIIEGGPGWWGLWIDCLDRTKPAFLKFTKGHKDEWCEKISLLFETGFDSVVDIAREIRTLNLKVLHLYIENFFDKYDLFEEEEWFLCTGCFKNTDWYDEESKLCRSCAHIPI